MNLRAPAPSVIHGSGIWEDRPEWRLHPRFAELWTIESPENGSFSFTHRTRLLRFTCFSPSLIGLTWSTYIYKTKAHSLPFTS